MMPVRRVCSVLVACAYAVTGLAGCSSGPGPVCACPYAAHPRAYALDVTTAGQVRWQVRLAGPALGSGSLSALAVGAVAVFAQGDLLSQGDVLYGLRLADGRGLWSRAFSQGIAGMWRWQNLVVVLTQGSGQQQQSVLAGLDASTGQARWTLRVDGSVEDGFSQTADGGLAVNVDREDGVLELEVVDLSSGRVRWIRPVDSDAVPPVAVGGGAVLFAGGADGDANSSLTSYDDRTGQVRWTEALSPWILPPLQASAGLVYLTAELPRRGVGLPPLVLLGIRAADGRVKWRFAASPQESLDVYAPGLMSVTTTYDGTSQDELDPATGRVRWHVASPDHAIASPAGIIVITPGPDSAPAATTEQISVRDTLTGQTRWTAELNEPLAAGLGQLAPALPVFPAGPLLVVPAASPDGSEMLAAFRMSDGHRAWQVAIRGPVEAPLSTAPGGMLVYAGG
jgi:outer membrane protein assembly factor BamB